MRRSTAKPAVDSIGTAAILRSNSVKDRMGTGTDRQQARKALFRAIVYAFAGAALQVLSVRMLSYVFPFQMIFAVSLIAAFSILFSGLGALFARRLRPFTAPLMAVTGILFLCSFLLMALGSFLPKQAMFSVTLEHVLALLPASTIATIPLAALVVAAPLFLMGALTGGFYLTVLETDRALLKALVAGTAVAFLVGYIGCAWLITHTGIWNLILAASAIAALAFLPPLRFSLATAALCVAIFAVDPDRVLFDLLGREPLIWSSGPERTRLAGSWSPYARLDFYRVGDHKLAGLYNGIQWWATGDTEHDLPIRREIYRHLTGDILVIGAGGGHGLLSLTNASSITAVELDPGVVETLAGPLADYNDRIYRRVETYAMEGRAFLDATERRFDAIIYEAPEFVFANSEKSFVNMENYLYTIEGISRAFDRLRPGGLFLIYHTYGLIPTERFAKAYPSDAHWAVFRTEATLIKEVKVVFAVASRDAGVIKQWRELLSRSGAEEWSAEPGFLATLDKAHPVTDDRPLLHLRDWRQTIPFIVALFLIGMLLVAVLLRHAQRRRMLFFTLIGIGFIMTELAVINLLRSTLGGYVETSGVAIGMLLIATAAGTLLHDKIPPRLLAPLSLGGFLLLFFLLATMPPAAPILLKTLWICGAVAIPGIVMGVFFPAGLAAAAAGESATCYAMDTIGTAFGFILFYLLIAVAGFSGAMAAALACYLAAALIFMRR